MQSIIEVAKLSKKYRFGVEHTYLTFRDVVSSLGTNLMGLMGEWQTQNSHLKNNEFWALKDISLEIKPGEIVGIIGPNGSGKSTLLKILSRITMPTEGVAKIRGRVASLLEVGTGFSPELTGRENIYLNGAILGMHQKEIKQKFDEIVAFAEVDKFIDTVVKYYSSGMYMRLAFAVAAHLQPEILLVDEVLAVGDSQFQKKCLGKMNEVSKSGRTIIFVSHNMQAIRNLCQRTIYLERGKIVACGQTSTVVDKYLKKSILNVEATDRKQIAEHIVSNTIFKLNSITVKQRGSQTGHFVASRDIEITVNYELKYSKQRFFVGIELWDTDGNRLVETLHNANQQHPITEKGKYVSIAIIPLNSLTALTYELRIEMGIFGKYNFTKSPITFMFDVQADSPQSTIYLFRPAGGKVILPIKWQTKRI